MDNKSNNEDEEEEEEMNLYHKNENKKNIINQININSRNSQDNRINLGIKGQNSERKNLMGNNYNIGEFNDNNSNKNGTTSNYNQIVFYGQQALRGNEVNYNDKDKKENKTFKKKTSVKGKMFCNKCKCNCLIF